jgi:hypothetical protein
MISFKKRKNELILVYIPEFGNADWVDRELHRKGDITLKKTFTFTNLDVREAEKETDEGDFEDDFDEPEYHFRLGIIEHNGYYKIERDIIGLDNELFIYSDIPLRVNYFVAPRNISIFRKIDKLVNENIYVGGKKDKAIPFKAFQEIIDFFPNTYELDRYAESRVSAILKNYVDSTKDAERTYTNLMNQKPSVSGDNLMESFRKIELFKYQSILSKLRTMLNDEVNYSEKQWQKEIIQIILLLYPKYIFVFEEVKIRDTYNGKDRKLDYMLVDSAGNTDIIEIKKPFSKAIVSQNLYRDNHIPIRDLSGTVMQIEKYIFYMNKWGKRGEDIISQKYKSVLPNGFRIKITNPKGIIIMGRHNNLTTEQYQDFEIIKRKYSNVIDIITYDDLIGRLSRYSDDTLPVIPAIPCQSLFDFSG